MIHNDIKDLLVGYSRLLDSRYRPLVDDLLNDQTGHDPQVVEDFLYTFLDLLEEEGVLSNQGLYFADGVYFYGTAPGYEPEEDESTQEIEEEAYVEDFESEYEDTPRSSKSTSPGRRIAIILGSSLALCGIVLGSLYSLYQGRVDKTPKENLTYRSTSKSSVKKSTEDSSSSKKSSTSSSSSKPSSSSSSSSETPTSIHLDTPQTQEASPSTQAQAQAQAQGQAQATQPQVTQPQVTQPTYVAPTPTTPQPTPSPGYNSTITITGELPQSEQPSTEVPVAPSEGSSTETSSVSPSE